MASKPWQVKYCTCIIIFWDSAEGSRAEAGFIGLSGNRGWEEREEEKEEAKEEEEEEEKEEEEAPGAAPSARRHGWPHQFRGRGGGEGLPSEPARRVQLPVLQGEGPGG